MLNNEIVKPSWTRCFGKFKRCVTMIHIILALIIWVKERTKKKRMERGRERARDRNQSCFICFLRYRQHVHEARKWHLLTFNVLMCVCVRLWNPSTHSKAHTLKWNGISDERQKERRKNERNANPSGWNIARNCEWDCITSSLRTQRISFYDCIFGFVVF